MIPHRNRANKHTLLYVDNKKWRAFFYSFSASFFSFLFKLKTTHMLIDCMLYAVTSFLYRSLSRLLHYIYGSKYSLNDCFAGSLTTTTAMTTMTSTETFVMFCSILSVVLLLLLATIFMELQFFIDTNTHTHTAIPVNIKHTPRQSS